LPQACADGGCKTRQRIEVAARDDLVKRNRLWETGTVAMRGVYGLPDARRRNTKHAQATVICRVCLEQVFAGSEGEFRLILALR
jgi:hypothetical protein